MKSRVFTIENAPDSVLREWVRQQAAKLDEQRDAHWLGWWIGRHVATATFTTHTGTTITVDGAHAIEQVRAFIRTGETHHDRRAA